MTRTGKVIPIEAAESYRPSVPEQLRNQFVQLELDPDLFMTIGWDIDFADLTVDTSFTIESLGTSLKSAPKGFTSFVEDLRHKKRVGVVMHPGREGVDEGVGYEPFQDAVDEDRPSEQLRVYITPTAFKRCLEPVVTIARVQELVESSPTPEEQSKLMRIGTIAVTTLGISYAAFAEHLTRGLQPLAFRHALAELGLPSEEESLTPAIDNISLRMSGTVLRRTVIDELGDQFPPQDSHDTQLRKMDMIPMWNALAASRHITGDRTMHRRASFAIENAYTVDEAAKVIAKVFRHKLSSIT